MSKTTGEDTSVGCSRPLGGMDCIIEAGDKPVKGGRCCSYIRALEEYIRVAACYETL